MWIEISLVLLSMMLMSLHSTSPELPKMTLEELQMRNDPVLAVFGYVFNVTSAPEFYDDGEKYEQFRGHDCTRAFAMSSLDVEDLDKSLDNLSETELKRVEESYQYTYMAKYPIIAEVSDPPYDVAMRPKRNADGILGSRGASVNHGIQGQCPFTKQVKKIKDTLYSLLPPLLTGATE